MKTLFVHSAARAFDIATKLAQRDVEVLALGCLLMGGCFSLFNFSGTRVAVLRPGSDFPADPKTVWLGPSPCAAAAGLPCGGAVNERGFRWAAWVGRWGGLSMLG